MSYFKERLKYPEIMDDFSIQDERIDKALEELKMVNKFLGGISTTLNGMKKLLENNYSKKIKVLDAGSGASDVFNKSNYNSALFSLDRNKKICNYLKKNSQNTNVVYGNALELPFKRKSFDVVHASLFLHHFDEEDINKLLKLFSHAAAKGIIINDLRRSLFAYLGIKILTMLFSKSELVKNDGPLSVKKGFTKDELIKLLSSVPFENYEIKRTWAFRWLVIIYL
jgi:2-polyprenyl-3-methyl-5-hydroxy-6-metoxy-1,4-benzoquinol methylase